MKLRTSKKTIFVHPNGYFEVVEISGVNLMGDTFRYREAFYTPNHDRREVAREEDLPTHFARMGHLESGDCKPRKAYRLNAEEQEYICSMFQNGMSTAKIAQQMGCSVQTVRNVTKDLREPKMVRMWSEVDKAKAREMWFDGCSFSQIGRALDRNPSSVRDMLQRELKLHGQ